MNANESVFDETENSKLEKNGQTDTESLSILNNNVELSNMDLSEEKVECSTFIHELSVILDDEECRLLKEKKNCKKFAIDESVADLSVQPEDSSMEISRISLISEAEHTNNSVEKFSKMCAMTTEGMTDSETGTQIIDVDDDDDYESETDVLNGDIKATIATNDINDASECASENEGEFFNYDLIELGRRLWPSTAYIQHYTKGCLWSPDGTCLLVPVHLDGMHVMELPQDLYNTSEISTDRLLSDFSTAVHVKEGGTVYDYVWYPFMNSNAPETCCWLATRQHEPIHMWDAFNGELRCTYRGYDSVDEVESAIALTFSQDGEKIIAGYKKNIKIFTTNNPGRDYTIIPIRQAASCFATTTDNDNTVTAGSWKGFICHYDLRAAQLGPLFTLGGHKGGITSLRYGCRSSIWSLYSGARRDNSIFEWDMRNYEKPVREFIRNVTTNQRIQFDLSSQLQWLISGDTEGFLRVWNLDLGANAPDDFIKLPIHNDCCNGVNLHPSLPILATSAGQYHFIDVLEDKEMFQQPLELDNSENNTKHPVIEKHINYENSLLMFWFGKHKATVKDF